MMGARPGAALAVHPPLVRLLSRLPLRVVAAPCPTPPEWPRLQNGDAVCPGANHRAMPLPPPLWADDRRRLAAAPGQRRVGLCWAASGAMGNPDPRSIPVEHLGPLLAVPGVAWTALHLADQAGAVPGVPSLVDYGVRDFADTAGLIRQLDVVITVDTAVLHLAANLGAPTWLLLGRTYWPGWWGGPIADHSPRYPAVRVFRQAVPGDWAPVVAQVAAALAAHPWPGCPAPQRVR